MPKERRGRRRLPQELTMGFARAEQGDREAEDPHPALGPQITDHVGEEATSHDGQGCPHGGPRESWGGQCPAQVGGPKKPR